MVESHQHAAETPGGGYPGQENRGQGQDYACVVEMQLEPLELPEIAQEVAKNEKEDSADYE